MISESDLARHLDDKHLSKFVERVFARPDTHHHDRLPARRLTATGRPAMEARRIAAHGSRGSAIISACDSWGRELGIIFVAVWVYCLLKVIMTDEDSDGQELNQTA